MKKAYLVKDKEGSLYYSPVLILENPGSMKIIDQEIRIKILKILSKESLFSAEIARKLGLHEQKIYYHVKQMLNAGILEITEKKEIRGTIAKKLASKEMNFAVSFSNEWNEISSLVKPGIDTELERFMQPFIKNGILDARIVVGSPDPHGPFKARSRDSHYAIDLSLFMGNIAKLPKNFSTTLDVDITSEKQEGNNLILVGGPVTNLIVSEMNSHFPVRFSDKKPWGLQHGDSKKKYTEDSMGVIIRIQNPNNPQNYALILAGVRSIGTKAAVMALTRNHKELLKGFKGEKEWAAVVQGFDLDGDGKIDSTEIIAVV